MSPFWAIFSSALLAIPNIKTLGHVQMGENLICPQMYILTISPNMVCSLKICYVQMYVLLIPQEVMFPLKIGTHLWLNHVKSPYSVDIVGSLPMISPYFLVRPLPIFPHWKYWNLIGIRDFHLDFTRFPPVFHPGPLGPLGPLGVKPQWRSPPGLHPAPPAVPIGSPAGSPAKCASARLWKKWWTMGIVVMKHMIQYEIYEWNIWMNIWNIWGLWMNKCSW